MEVLIALVILFVVVAPITISIVALSKVSTLRAELDGVKRALRLRMQAEAKTESDPEPVIKDAVTPALELKIQSTEAQPPPIPQKDPPPHSPKEPARPVPVPIQKKPEVTMEFLMGGRAAAFAGIAMLVMGIAFLVGYAIQNSWLGPAARVGLGLVSGLLLVGLGHFVSRKDEKYTLFARVLTGGGSALFYFVVFTAFAFYHLIGVWTAGIGLFICASAVFALAMLYTSQAVAVLGVLGAFITPILIGGNMDAGTFALVYVALINVPVILLGVRRKWQILYNLSFAFTVIHFVIWMDRISGSELWAGLGFVLVFFLQYAALGLLKLRHEQHVLGRNLDLVRLALSSLLLLGAVFWLLEEGGKDEWTGSAFVLIALLHFGLAQFAYKLLTRFTGEITAFISGGILFMTMALPAQLDGAWVTLGWGVEGALLAWFGLRVKSRILQSGAFFLGMIGLLKGLVFDVEAYDQTMDLFLNARFAVGMISAVLLGVQGKLAGYFREEDHYDPWQDVLWSIGILGMVVFFFSDVFMSLGEQRAFAWLLTSVMLLATGAGALLFAPQRSAVIKLGCILLIAVPIKVFFLDTWIFSEIISIESAPFSNAVIWVQLVMMGVLALAVKPHLASRDGDLILPAKTMEAFMDLSASAAALGVITLEIMRAETDWADTGVTLLWSLSALAMILFGMKNKRKAHRYFGLILFGLTTLKVLIVDSSELKGLERIGAFIGTGVLLLILSFAYQKASAYFQVNAEGDENKLPSQRRRVR